MQDLAFKLANGFTVLLTRYGNGEIVMELVNPEDFIVSDKKLNEPEIMSIISLLSK